MKPIHDAAKTAELTRRNDALVQAIHRRGLDHYVITTTENIFYLTHATFEPLERPFFLIIGADGERQMVVPTLEVNHMHKAFGVNATNLIAYREFPAPRGQGWVERLLDGHTLPGSFGFEPGTPWHIAEHHHQAKGEPVDLLEDIRIVKSDWEVTQIERAARYADEAVADILRRAWNGGTAAETFMAMQATNRKIMRDVQDWDPLSTKVLAAAWPAPLSAEPHAVPPLSMRLGAGPHVALAVTRVNGYTAECERTFFTSAPSAREREQFALMTAARQLAYSMLKPGTACAEIDGAVNTFLATQGFAKFHTRLHRCGHGFGLGNHEPPWLAEGSTHVLQAGMLVSIEPGIYLHNSGGLRHSDTVLITETGYRNLTHAPTELEDLVLPPGRWRQRLTGWMVARSLKLKRAAQQNEN